MASFENTKSEIVSSGLGQALALTVSNTWSQIVAKIKAIVNRGAVSQTLNCGGSYTIPQGYHNGSGKVTANSLASQTDANAAAAQILSGFTAWIKGNKVTGSMPNRGTLNWSGSNTTYGVPAGYYSGGTIDSRPSYTNGYNAGVSAGTSATRNLKSVTYNVTSEANSVKANDSKGSSHNVWRVPIPCISGAHRIVSAYWYETTGNQYQFLMDGNGRTMAGPKYYIIPIKKGLGNGEEWATKTYCKIYLICENETRGRAVTFYFV